VVELQQLLQKGMHSFLYADLWNALWKGKDEKGKYGNIKPHVLTSGF